MSSSSNFGLIMSSASLTNYHICHAYTLKAVEVEKEMPLSAEDNKDVTSLSANIETTWKSERQFHIVISNIQAEGDNVRKAIIVNSTQAYFDTTLLDTDKSFETLEDYNGYILTQGIVKIKGKNKGTIILDGSLPEKYTLPEGYTGDVTEEIINNSSDITHQALIVFVDDDDNIVSSSAISEETQEKMIIMYQA